MVEAICDNPSDNPGLYIDEMAVHEVQPSTGKKHKKAHRPTEGLLMLSVQSPAGLLFSTTAISLAVRSGSMA
jgi:hypothetical protein